MANDKRGKTGSSFDELLKKERIYEETQSVAAKRVTAWRLEQAMKSKPETLSKDQRKELLMKEIQRGIDDIEAGRYTLLTGKSEIEDHVRKIAPSVGMSADALEN